MNGWGVLSTLVGAFLVILIPGFILSWALFPKKEDLRISERLGISLALGLVPIFLLMLLNMTLEVKVTFMTDLLMVLVVSIAGLIAFLYRGGAVKVGEKTLIKSMSG